MITKITVDTTGVTDKQAAVLFLQALKHRRKAPKVKEHTYELNSVNANVRANKTIQVRNKK